jgi:hypothetical protein
MSRRAGLPLVRRGSRRQSLLTGTMIIPVLDSVNGTTAKIPDSLEGLKNYLFSGISKARANLGNPRAHWQPSSPPEVPLSRPRPRAQRWPSGSWKVQLGRRLTFRNEFRKVPSAHAVLAG